jgi:hypothetical protein
MRDRANGQLTTGSATLGPALPRPAAFQAGCGRAPSNHSDDLSKRWSPATAPEPTAALKMDSYCGS